MSFHKLLQTQCNRPLTRNLSNRRGRQRINSVNSSAADGAVIMAFCVSKMLKETQFDIFDVVYESVEHVPPPPRQMSPVAVLH